MKCPNCGNEMKGGYLRATGPGGVCWINRKINYGVPRSAEEFVLIGKAPYLRGDCIPACNCDACKIILIDYSSIE